MNERIRKLRRTLDLTQKDFGSRIGVKGNTIAQYELGRNKPVDAVLSLMCREFNVNKDWLLYGKGEMFLPNETDEIQILAQKYNLSEEAIIFLKKFAQTSPAVQDAFIDFINEVVNEINNFKSNSSESSKDEELDTIGNDIDTVSAAEAAYENALHIAHKMDSTASNTSRKREA